MHTRAFAATHKPRKKGGHHEARVVTICNNVWFPFGRKSFLWQSTEEEDDRKGKRKEGRTHTIAGAHPPQKRRGKIFLLGGMDGWGGGVRGGLLVRVELRVCVSCSSRFEEELFRLS
jgi:hypothetical protein